MSRTALQRVFVTVGTTKFDGLVSNVLSSACLEVLEASGAVELVVQYGTGVLPAELPGWEETDDDKEAAMDDAGTQVFVKSDGSCDMRVRVFSLKPSTAEEIAAADLVIGHCGAGTVLDVLYAGKAMLAVVNTTLMDNHQTELAEALERAGYLWRLDDVDQLADQLQLMLKEGKYLDSDDLLPYPPAEHAKRGENTPGMDMLLRDVHNDLLGTPGADL